jgi:O-antigen/teichoic acid export membrane protein
LDRGGKVAGHGAWLPGHSAGGALLGAGRSLAALFGVAGHLGLQGLVVRELVKKSALRAETLGTTAVLKLGGVLLGYIALLFYAAVYEGAGSGVFYLIAVSGTALLFTPLNVIDNWFNAFVQARYVSVARVAGALVFGLPCRMCCSPSWSRLHYCFCFVPGLGCGLPTGVSMRAMRGICWPRAG